ncbi:hypothetical protein H7849_19050 [Alloacidobacterium dinghuense]|uniref:Uncharacterized protein n=1 Tax=Alloacidobacterium dinghuense TaxID=2763107 RepID=A0A7G8BF55_9BACT|nr:hypothetical protein [Alloacidobacterium dinghuense]QNI31175.1 hypothetical protein H7849_19050 [Alloacidobacterium dinghuense]
MDRSGGGMVAAAVLLAVFAGGGIRGSQSSQPNASTDTAVTAGMSAHSAETAAPAGEQSNNKRDGYADEIRRLTAFIADAKRNTSVLNEDQQADPNSEAERAESRTAFMIALVPDPAKTHLSLVFDRYVDALEQAIQDGGFDFDRALLPWDEHDHPESSNFGTRLDEREYVRGEQQAPGVLVFRRHYFANEKPSSESIETLVVFVVGESPTAGINRGQFVTAIGLAKRLAPKTEGAQPLTIAGPSFSGSLYSLAALLKSEGHSFSRIAIASGTVSDPDSVESFRASIGQTFGKDGQANFAIFEENSRVKLRAFVSFACQNWNLQPSNIAVISETETAFGRQQNDDDRELCPDSSGENARHVRLYFPRGIFHVRSAYEQQFPGGNSADDDRPPLRTTLRPNLEEKHGSADSVPEFSPQLPVSQDAVLTGLVDQLHRRRVGVIVLLASDPLDTLFLVRYFKKNYPYAHLVTMGSDLLLRHESPDPAMLGVLALTTYSLQPAESKTDVNSPNGIVFPDDGSAGLYNATAALLWCILSPSTSWCLNGPSSEKLPSELGLMGFTQVGKNDYATPALYLDALGRDGFLHVAILQTTESWLPQQKLTATGSGSEFRREMSLPSSWKVLAIAVLSGIGLFIFCLCRASIVSTIEAEILLAPADTMENDFTRVGRKSLIVFLACAWMAVLMLVYRPAFMTGAWPNGEFRLYVFAALIAGSGLSGVMVHRFSGSIRYLPVISFVACVLTCVGIAVKGQSVELRRYIDVFSQISPVMPLFLLALSVIWWLWYNIAACVLTDSRRPLLPARKIHGGVPIDISAEEQKGLESAMAPGHLDRRLWIPAILLGVFTYLFIGPKPLVWSVEGRGYNWLVTLALVVSFGLLAESVVRILVVWKEARHLLRGLNQQPFRTKMCTVGGITWNAIWKVGIAAVSMAHSFFSRQSEALCLLLRSRAEAQETVAGPVPPSGEVVTADKPEYKLLYSFRALMQGVTFPENEQQTKANGDMELSEEMYKSAEAVKKQGGLVWRKYEELLGKGREHGSDRNEIQRRKEMRLLAAYSRAQGKFADAAGSLMDGLMRHYPTHPEIVRELDADAIKQAQKDAPRSVREISEYFVNMLYMNYIVTILLRIRSLAAATAGIFVFEVLALNSYPFEPRAFLRAAMFAILILITTCFAVVYAQMHRDPVLSRMTDTKSGELGGDFWMRMLSLTGLPIVSLVATQFPSVGNFLFSWVGPLMKVAR